MSFQSVGFLAFLAGTVLICLTAERRHPQAGRLLLLDREQVVAFANRHGMAIVGIDSGLPPAPLRP